MVSRAPPFTEACQIMSGFGVFGIVYHRQAIQKLRCSSRVRLPSPGGAAPRAASLRCSSSGSAGSGAVLLRTAGFRGDGFA